MLARPFRGGPDLPDENRLPNDAVPDLAVAPRTFPPGFTPASAVAWIDIVEGARAFGDVVDCPLRMFGRGDRAAGCGSA
ncbi:MAG TPA: hypothetical protein VE465_00200 [Streptosporangiaceae bacterium]|nr:hypothetical protein [Streptosporangiaceae bacterium]